MSAFGGNSGKALLIVSISAFDPERTRAKLVSGGIARPATSFISSRTMLKWFRLQI